MPTAAVKAVQRKLKEARGAKGAVHMAREWGGPESCLRWEPKEAKGTVHMAREGRGPENYPRGKHRSLTKRSLYKF